MNARRLQVALQTLAEAIRDVESLLAEVRADHDPLAAHIFVSRRAYRLVSDSKSGKRREISARLSWERACELGFRGSLGDWAQLLGAVPKR